MWGAIGSIVGGLIGAKGASDSASKNTAYQKEFAQKGIGWRVKDAKSSGIHPLAALNASGASYTPVTDNSAAILGSAVADAGTKVSQKAQIKAQTAMQQKLTDSEIAVNKAQAALFATEAQRNVQGATVMTGNMQNTPGQEPQNQPPPTPLLERILMPDGSIREIPIGPDMDEFLMGGVLYIYDKARDLWAPEESRAKPKRQKRGSAGGKKPPVVNLPTGNSSVRRKTQ